MGFTATQMVELLMLARRQAEKVLWGIVGFFAVQMMNVLIRCKGSTITLFPYNAMLQHIAIPGGSGMIRAVNHYIAKMTKLSQKYRRG